jgi:DnaK suppressor protein
MDPIHLERARNQLLEQRAKLLRKDAGLAEESKELLDGGDLDLVDHAQTATALLGVRELDDKERRALIEIDAALSRIATGSYGVCMGCGEPMPPRRLEALPTARECLECADPRAAAAR